MLVDFPITFETSENARFEGADKLTAIWEDIQAFMPKSQRSPHVLLADVVFISQRVLRAHLPSLGSNGMEKVDSANIHPSFAPRIVTPWYKVLPARRHMQAHNIWPADLMNIT